VSQEAVSGLTAVAFSPVRPLVFAAASIDGFVYLFDLSISETTPVVTLEVPIEGGTRGESSTLRRRSAASGVQRPGLVDLAFNRKQRDLLAACDTAGKVHIWRLSWALANGQTGEEAILASLLK
jgi:WD40 repeat protein